MPTRNFHYSNNSDKLDKLKNKSHKSRKIIRQIDELLDINNRERHRKEKEILKKSNVAK
jgi:hypothetical protein